MVNKTGGKNYKKSKHSTSEKSPFIDKQDDQFYARIVKNFGNRNMLCYCNDNKIRLCHIRGAMRKRVWLNIGDIVLVSLRDFEKDITESGKSYDRGDIVAKYDEEHYGKLKKMPDINKRLFQQIETVDGNVLAEIGRREKEVENASLIPINEDGFEFEHEDKTRGAEDKDDGSDSEEDEESDAAEKVGTLGFKRRQMLDVEDDEFDIDNI